MFKRTISRASASQKRETWRDAPRSAPSRFPHGRRANAGASETTLELPNRWPDAGIEDIAPTVRTVEVCLVSITLILAFGAVYLAKAILLPIALALLLTLTFSPVVRYLARWYVPEWLSATFIVVSLVGAATSATYTLSEPVSGWIEGAPQTMQSVEQKLRGLKRSVDGAVSASKKMGDMATPDDPAVQKVAVQQSGIVTDAAGGLISALTTVGITIVLMFFLLASGRMFYEKLVRVLPTLAEKKRAIRIVHQVEEEVSTYLLTISAINAALGIVIGLVMWGLGMPNPALWGVMAAALNFIPYVGALIGVAIVGLVALVSFDAPQTAILVAGAYWGCTLIEGQFVTPSLLGRRLELNTVVVFVSLAFWGWLWGIAGALMAVPLLVILRVLCDHFDGLATLGAFLGGAPSTQVDDEAGEGSATSS